MGVPILASHAEVVRLDGAQWRSSRETCVAYNLGSGNAWIECSRCRYGRARQSSTRPAGVDWMRDDVGRCEFGTGGMVGVGDVLVGGPRQQRWREMGMLSCLLVRAVLVWGR